MKKGNRINWILGASAVLCTTGLVAVAQNGAQPGTTYGQGDGSVRPNFQNMTPEQRQEMMQQGRTRALRSSLEQAGLTDTALQDAVVAFSTEQETARQALREQSQKLAEAAHTATTTDAELTAQLKAFRAAVALEKARSAKALTALDAKIGYSTKPRLEATLTTLGLVGDEASFVGGGQAGAGGRGFGGGAGAWGAGGWGGRGGNGGNGPRQWGNRGGRGRNGDNAGNNANPGGNQDDSNTANTAGQ